MPGDRLPKPGVYIHVPLCKSKCSYCDFYSITDGDQTRYINAVVNEIYFYAKSVIPKCRARVNPAPRLDVDERDSAGDKPRPYNNDVNEIDTLYLGGGTPSLLTLENLERLISAVRDSFALAEDLELTLEANPDDVNRELLEAWRGLGVNRLSLGAQSFFDEDLKLFGRRHSAKQVTQALEAARKAGFDNIGLDLIYGFFGQSTARWKSCLNEALSLEPEHLSCYQLTIAEDTPLGREAAAGRFERLDEENERRFFLTTSEVLRTAGFEHYEVSNFAREPELRSRHNQKYWRHAAYVGLGPAAHSFVGRERWSNVKSFDDYCESLESGKEPIEEKEFLSDEQLLTEELMLGFRTSDGVEMESVKRLADWERKLRELEREGLVFIEDGHVRPTAEGFLVADSLLLRLL